MDAKLQESFTELQFQCDRRATEIYSVVVRMHDLAQRDAVRGVIDEQVTEYLNATFKELMPREAILMHGTAEALETMKRKFADEIRPLAEKLEAFAANSTRTLSVQEVAEPDAAMATMKNTLAYVRTNGLEVRHYGKEEDDGRILLVGEENENRNFTVTHTEVDKSLLDEMEKVIDAAKEQIDGAKEESVARARRAFHRDEAQQEFKARLLKDPGLNINQVDGTVTVDLSKAKSPELCMTTTKAIGSRSIAMPQEIDKEFYDKLIEMDNNPAKKQEYLQFIAP